MKKIDLTPPKSVLPELLLLRVLGSLSGVITLPRRSDNSLDIFGVFKKVKSEVFPASSSDCNSSSKPLSAALVGLNEFLDFFVDLFFSNSAIWSSVISN